MGFVWTDGRVCRALILAWGLYAVVQAGATTGFERYEIILSRRPFGDPPEAASAAPPVPEAPPFTKDLRMVAISEVDGTYAVGFINIGVNPHKNHYLLVGETDDGIELVRADYDKEAALLRKDGVELWIDMSGTPATASATPAAGTPPSGLPPGLPSRVSGPGARPGVAVTSGLRPPGAAPGGMPRPATLSYAQRLAERRAALAQAQVLSREDYNRQLAEGTRAAPISPRLARAIVEGETNTPVESVLLATPEERERRLREYNMELIRQRGALGPVLPIQLTPEEDAQLVSEGVLPPADPEAPPPAE